MLEICLQLVLYLYLTNILGHMSVTTILNTILFGFLVYKWA